MYPREYPGIALSALTPWPGPRSTRHGSPNSTSSRKIVKPTGTNASRSSCGRPDIVSDLYSLSHSHLLTDRLKEANRSRFLNRLDASFKSDKTVLFSVVQGHEPKIQALIPHPIIESVDIYLQQCAERETESNDQIGAYGTADWGTASMPGRNMGSDAA